MTDEQAAPFGINECLLLPSELRDFTVSTCYSGVSSAVELCQRFPVSPTAHSLFVSGRSEEIFIKVVPVISKSVNAMLENLLKRDRMPKACEASNVDDTLKVRTISLSNNGLCRH